MSQVAKSASAFVRAFLAMLVLELEDMVVRLVRPPKLVNVHGDRWTVRMSGLAQSRTLRRLPGPLSAAVRTLGRSLSSLRKRQRPCLHRR
jgi:hypothetical protein